MPALDLAIRNGTVVTAAEIAGQDIGIKDGKIALMGPEVPQAESEIDAEGMFVLPGGIDSHVHI